MLKSTKLSLLAVCNGFTMDKRDFDGDHLKTFMLLEVEDWFVLNPRESAIHDSTLR